MNDFSALLEAACQKIASQKPIVHQITNFVTMTDCANAVCAVGASPVMAYAPEEAAEVTALSQALVLNLGTPDPLRFETAIGCGQVANRWQIPVVLDPVGVGGTAFRKENTARLLQAVHPNIIKGNVAEMKTLSGLTPGQNRLIDSSDQLNDQTEEALVALAAAQNTVLVVSGPVNFLTDGKRRAHIAGGSAFFTRFSGAGCMTGALMGAFAAVCPAFEAALLAAGAMNACGAWAEEKACGVGSFKQYLYDGLSRLPDLEQMELWKKVGIDFES